MNRRQFLLASATAALAGACAPRGDFNLAAPLPERPNIIVWLADALRADHLGPYGATLDTAPEIARFAERAVVFDHVFAAAPWTTPATLALLTGLPPLAHRTVVPEWSAAGKSREGKHQVLPASIPTTASLLRAAGYDTAHFQANPNASAEHGITGFNHYYYRLNAGRAEQTDAVVEWLRTQAREPFYAYIHLIDPHEPYNPAPDDFLRLHGRSIEDTLAALPPAEAARLDDMHRATWNGLFLEKKRPNPEDLSAMSPAAAHYLKDLYAAEIRGLDTQFARLRNTLKELDLDRRTIVAVTSDHGEAFGEDGHYYHGSALHDPQLHVPLVVGLPGLDREVRCDATASQCDIHPTLLALAGADTAGAYGSPLMDRTGRLAPQGTQPALSSLDLHQMDPAQWRYRLTAGIIIVESTDDFLRCQVRRKGDDEPVALYLEEIEAWPDREIADAAMHFYTERHYLDQLAEKHGEPGWWAPPAPEAGALEALGYL